MKKYPNLEARMCTTAAKYGISVTGLHGIIRQLCEKGKLAAAVRDFFRPLPYGDYVSDTILAYESKPRLMKLIMETIGMAAYVTENVDIMRRISSVARASRGRPLYVAMRTIGVVSRRTNDSSAVEKVVEVASAYQKSSLEVVMRTIEYAAKILRDSPVVAAQNVSNVAEALAQESVKALSSENYGAVLLDGIGIIAYSTGDKDIVCRMAKAFHAEAQQLSERYAGQNLTDRLNVLVETAVQNGNPEDIKKIARRW